MRFYLLKGLSMSLKQSFNTNILLLLLAQGISGAVVSLLTFCSALASKYLLDDSLDSITPSHHSVTLHSLINLDTLSISATLCGSFLAILFSSKLMLRFGRKKVFLWACVLGMLGALLGMYALELRSFYLFILATFLLGFFTATNQFYRFLAQEALKTTHQAHRATAFIVGGGILGGILGPNLANAGVYLSNTLFLGSFFFALLLCFVNLLLTLPLKLNPIKQNLSSKTSLKECLKEKDFIFATLACAFGFALMTLVMNAAPLAMKEYNFSNTDSKNVLVWHFIAMYAPSFFLGFFKDLNPKRLIFLGMALYFVAAVIGIVSQDFLGFWLSLVLVGIAWCFSFNGGTFLLNAISSPYKLKLQELNALATFLANFIASLSVGGILASGGYIVLNITLLVAVFVFFVLIFKCK